MDSYKPERDYKAEKGRDRRNKEKEGYNEGGCGAQS